MSMHRQQAIRKVRVAQALVLIFAAGAAAAMVVPRPDHSLPLPSADVPVTTAPAGESRPASGLESQDLASVLIVLNTHVDIKDRAVAEARVMPEVVKDDPAPAQEQPKDVAAGTWRFVGSIISPRSTAAIINDEHNKQHIVFAGDKLNGTTLVAVTHDRIVLRDGDEHSASRELSLEPRPDTLLPDAPTAMAMPYSPGQNELPAEYANTPPEFSTWPPAQQREWSERRAQLVKQMQDMNARNSSGGGKPVAPGGRPPTRAVPQPGKPPTTGKDFK